MTKNHGYKIKLIKQMCGKFALTIKILIYIAPSSSHHRLVPRQAAAYFY
jgi:hypothetical protein